MWHGLAVKLLRHLALPIALLGAAPALADTKPPPKTEEVSQADAEKHLDFFNKFADTIIANKDDCKKLTGALDTFVDANTENIKKAREIKERKLRMPKAIEEKMMARLKEMVVAMQKCQGDADVKKALERAKGEPKKPSEKAASK